jgi:hypothetical protein
MGGNGLPHQDLAQNTPLQALAIMGKIADLARVGQLLELLVDLSLRLTEFRLFHFRLVGLELNMQALLPFQLEIVFL